MKWTVEMGNEKFHQKSEFEGGLEKRPKQTEIGSSKSNEAKPLPPAYDQIDKWQTAL